LEISIFWFVFGNLNFSSGFVSCLENLNSTFAWQISNSISVLSVLANLKFGFGLVVFVPKFQILYPVFVP